MALRPLIRRVGEVVRSRTAVGLVFALLTLLGVQLLQRESVRVEALPPLTLGWPLLVIALLGQLGYIVGRSITWLYSWRQHGVMLSFAESLRLFLVSAAIDAVVFPSAVSSDLYKIAYLKSVPLTTKLSAILHLRIGILLPYFAVAGAGLVGWEMTTVAFTLAALALSLPRIRTWIAITCKFPLRPSVILGVTLYDALTTICNFTRVWAILAALGYPHLLPLEFAVGHLSGALSGVPMGLGARDASWTYFLHNHLSIERIALFLVAHRLSGELLSGVLGWLVAADQVTRFLARGAVQIRNIPSP